MLSQLFFGMAMVCCVAAVIYIVIRLVICAVKHKKFVLKKEIPIILFVAYCVGLFFATIPIYSVLHYGNHIMINGVYHSVNLIPFKQITGYIIRRDSIGEISFANLVGNILLFAPMGFLLPVIFKKMKNMPAAVLTGAVVSTCIEATQYLFGRSADIDDVILNTVGTLLGFLLYLVIKAITKKWLFFL